jgi:hypothetical protein
MLDEPPYDSNQIRKTWRDKEKRKMLDRKNPRVRTDIEIRETIVPHLNLVRFLPGRGQNWRGKIVSM